MQRVYSLALRDVAERIVIDGEIERRLAVLVLFVYSAATADSFDIASEKAMVALCVERLMARTASTE